MRPEKSIVLKSLPIIIGIHNRMVNDLRKIQDYKAVSLIHPIFAPNVGILAGISLEGKLHIGMNAKLPEKKQLKS